MCCVQHKLHVCGIKYLIKMEKAYRQHVKGIKLSEAFRHFCAQEQNYVSNSCGLKNINLPKKCVDFTHLLPQRSLNHYSNDFIFPDATD